MSVNVFGSSGGAKISSDVNKKYVDQKFVTLSTNLATKVNKSGDTISGNLNISLDGDNLRTFGVKDSSTGKSVVLFLGDFNNRIVSNFDNALQIFSSHGIKLAGQSGDICWFGSKTGPQAMFYKSINMNENYIGGLKDPNWEQDAATKSYVDTRFVKNSVGYVPILTTSLSKNDFVVSEYSYHSPQNMGYQVFNRSLNDWVVAEGVKTNCWLKLRCPESIRIYKFALRGRSGSTAKHNFKLQGNNEDDDNWTDIFSGSDVLLSNTVSSFNVAESILYSYYRIFVIDSDMIGAPGLSYWQLYTLDPIYTV